MAQAIVDPEQLRQFAGLLRRYNHQLRESTTTLSQALGRLSETWRDQEQHKFDEEFQDQLRQVTKLIERSELHIPYLLKKAELIEQYLQR